MVKERRYVFDPEDIESVLYCCPHCGHESGFKVNGKEHTPTGHCAACNASNMPATLNDGVDPGITFIVNLRKLLNAQRSPAKRVRVRLIVRDPD